MRRLISIFRTGLNYTRNASFPVAHYYSPIVDIKAYKESVASRVVESSPLDIQLSPEGHMEHLALFRATNWATPDWYASDKRFKVDNLWYPLADAMVLNTFLAVFKPKKIVEVGSGFSSASMLDVKDENAEWTPHFVFIEPNPERLLDRLSEDDKKKVEIVPKEVQDVEISLFETLTSNDLLVIDSSHVAKAGSDVNFLFFSILPRLQPGVIVHIHDIFYPFEYPQEWIEGGRNWNEIYLLRTFLQNNEVYEVLFFTDYFHQQFPGPYKEIAGLEKAGGSSIFIRKKA